MNELIDYIPHIGAGWDADNALVLQILVELVTNTNHAASVELYLRTRDGRGAYLALTRQSTGNSIFQTLMDAAETFVLQLPWNKKNQRYSLKVQINRHWEAHNNMVRAHQHDSMLFLVEEQEYQDYCRV